ncbi:hypothetical protein GCM10020229_03510 [Kitasatospora albolonga]
MLAGAADTAPALGAALRCYWAVLWLSTSRSSTSGSLVSFGWESCCWRPASWPPSSGNDRVAPRSRAAVGPMAAVRVRVGAGLIKMRGDACWRDLTCLRYTTRPQPMRAR